VARAADVRCGYLTVPENRRGGAPAERGSLTLAFAVFKAQTPSASPPLIYLAGGPGAGSIGDIVNGEPGVQYV
jgi:hypothetical protein